MARFVDRQLEFQELEGLRVAEGRTLIRNA